MLGLQQKLAAMLYDVNHSVHEIAAVIDMQAVVLAQW